MGREVRRVPENWQHPKKDNGRYVPLLGRSFAAELADWDEQKAKWDEGLRRDYSVSLNDVAWKAREPDDGDSFDDWHGERPQVEDYMPDWPDAERTHLQMYEDTTEGTPISPVMATAEELARWLADNNASAFAGQTASYESWLATIKRGWAPSAVSVGGGPLQSGVSALAQ